MTALASLEIVHKLADNIALITCRDAPTHSLSHWYNKRRNSGRDCLLNLYRRGYVSDHVRAYELVRHEVEKAASQAWISADSDRINAARAAAEKKAAKINREFRAFISH